MIEGLKIAIVRADWQEPCALCKGEGEIKCNECDCGTEHMKDCPRCESPKRIVIREPDDAPVARARLYFDDEEQPELVAAIVHDAYPDKIIAYDRAEDAFMGLLALREMPDEWVASAFDRAA